MEGYQKPQKGNEWEEMVLGIEFGSTRIKAVLIDQNNEPIVSGSHEWENQYVNDFWTYSIENIWTGLQDCYSKLADAFHQKFHRPLTTVSAIGFSAMMHGYMPFGKDGDLLVPFRTWRNTTTGQAADQLTELFQFNIPQRWSIAHLYQAILNREPHVSRISYLTTLSGYVHWQLSGRKVLGIGDASGMFPIDGSGQNYDQRMIELFNSKVAEKNYPWKLQEILPEVIMAGEPAGFLSEKGARLIDPSGRLQAGIPLCPPEGDAGTGMVATNSVAEQTGNISAGTSIFAMIVLEKPLSKVYPEIDMVTTPAGRPVAMVHANNCTSDINAWVELFHEFSSTIGQEVSQAEIFERLFQKALEGEADCGNLLAYNYFSGEPITRLEEGRPLFVRMPDSRFSLANFMRMHLYSAIPRHRQDIEQACINQTDQQEYAADTVKIWGQVHTLIWQNIRDIHHIADQRNEHADQHRQGLADIAPGGMCEEPDQVACRKDVYGICIDRMDPEQWSILFFHDREQAIHIQTDPLDEQVMQGIGPDRHDRECRDDQDEGKAAFEAIPPTGELHNRGQPGNR